MKDKLEEKTRQERLRKKYEMKRRKDGRTTQSSSFFPLLYLLSLFVSFPFLFSFSFSFFFLLFFVLLFLFFSLFLVYCLATSSCFSLQRSILPFSTIFSLRRPKSIPTFWTQRRASSHLPSNLDSAYRELDNAR